MKGTAILVRSICCLERDLSNGIYNMPMYWISSTGKSSQYVLLESSEVHKIDPESIIESSAPTDQGYIACRLRYLIKGAIFEGA